MRKADLWKHILNFLKTLAAQMTIEKALRYGIYLYNTARRMKCVDIVEPVQIADIPIESLAESPDFRFVDKDMVKGKVSEKNKPPHCGRYKLVSFHNGSGGVSIYTIRVISRIFSWKLASFSEAVAVGQVCCFKDLGLEYGGTIAAFGTVIKKASALSSWLSLYYSPIVRFSIKEQDGKLVKEKTVHLHDLSDNYYSDHYLLMRVD
ncbi:MAG: hypothetical protein Q7S19_02350 [bacterium]|nr:hypothetical protein [bacterium]